MAISENILLKKLSDHLGKQLVFKQYGDKRKNNGHNSEVDRLAVES